MAFLVSELNNRFDCKNRATDPLKVFYLFFYRQFYDSIDLNGQIANFSLYYVYIACAVLVGATIQVIYSQALIHAMMYFIKTWPISLYLVIICEQSLIFSVKIENVYVAAL